MGDAGGADAGEVAEGGGDFGAGGAPGLHAGDDGVGEGLGGAVAGGVGVGGAGGREGEPGVEAGGEDFGARRVWWDGGGG